jgi:predicted translin family RNA/ssDNA-binding protein
MINKKEFEEIRKDLYRIDEKREEIIQTSREIISVSKQIIYAAQRNDMNEAERAILDIKGKISKLKKVNITTDTNINSVAFQEYVEAVTFFEFVKTGKIPSKKSLGVSSEDYLCGICDLTGELVRKAIFEVIHKNYSEAERIKTFVDEIYGEFLKLNLRNGELRKKSDSIKWNLKKLEEVMYDVAMKGRN